MTPPTWCPSCKEPAVDPQTAWNELLDAYADCTWDRAEELAATLLSWLDAGGFPPQTVQRTNVGPHFNRHVARSVCLFVLDRLKEVKHSP